MLADMQGNANEKEALRALREALTRAVQRDWVTHIPGLMPELEAVLQAAGGPLENVKMSETPAGESASQHRLPKTCRINLDKLGPDHAVSGHLRAILNLIGF